MPGRRHYLLAALGATALAVYGSLVPLHYTPRAFSDAVEAFRQTPYLTIGTGSRADWVSNILLFVPLGYLWLAVLILDVRNHPARVIAAVATAVALTVLAFGIEFTQLWFPPRTVSQNDIIAETIGGAAGTLIWLATGQATTEWLRTIARTRRKTDRVVQALQLYFVGFIIYAVLPLDLTISSDELLDKLRNGRLVLLPFSDLHDLETLYGVVRDIVVFFPIGVLLSRWKVPEGTQVRSVWMTTLLGAIVAGGIELTQVFIYTRYASTTDVILCTLSAWAAGTFMRRRAGQAASAVADVSSASRRALRWLLTTVAWAAVVVVVFCAPFDVSGSPQEWRQRYEGIWVIPFSRLYYSTEYNAVSDVLRKLLLFGVFGALANQVRRVWNVPPAVDSLLWIGVVLAGAGLSMGIEIAQVVLPPHFPDITDVVLGGLGALLGAAAGSRVLTGHTKK